METNQYEIKLRCFMHLCKDVENRKHLFWYAKAYSIKLQEQESMAEDLICWKHKRLSPVTE